MANNTSYNHNDTSNRNGNTKPIEKPITKGAELTVPYKTKNMYYKKQKPDKTTLTRNTSYIGETLEKKINRIVNNKEPIKDGAPIIYTDRREGVKPEYDIRTDRWELATEGTDYLNKSHITKRQEYHDKKTEAEKKLAEQAKQGMIKENGGAEPIQATDN